MTRNIRKRTTRQLTAVYEALKGDHSHPSAEEVYRRVRKSSPRVSLGTVYRNLQRLTEEGKIRTVHFGDRSARYDPTLEDHDHFICHRCGRVEDIWLKRDRQMNVTPLVNKGFVVLEHSLAIHGLCPQCGQRRASRRRSSPTQHGPRT
ncbi:MAG: transcriptional repressor [Deltaproteobacteria bacterium]|nr:transcriptional repressor [Deltaproteobacteria bacterium]